MNIQDLSFSDLLFEVDRRQKLLVSIEELAEVSTEIIEDIVDDLLSVIYERDTE